MVDAKEKFESGIVIRRESGLPVYRQLVDQLRFLVAAGRYRAGTYLPTMRVLADELGLNVNTVNRAYRQLQRDGLVRSTPGRGALVVGGLAAEASAERATVVTDDQTDAILAAAIERALSAGLAPSVIAARVDAILAGFDGRVPPPPRVEVFGGREWRSRALAERLAGSVKHDVRPFAPDHAETDALVLVVRPRFGEWVPGGYESLAGERLLDLPVVPSREAVRSLVDLEPGAALLVLAADDAVARWLADVVSFANPSRVRWLTVEDASAARAEGAEIVVCEAGLPGADGLGGIAVAPAFAVTVGAEIDRALEAPF